MDRKNVMVFGAAALISGTAAKCILDDSDIQTPLSSVSSDVPVVPVPLDMRAKQQEADTGYRPDEIDKSKSEKKQTMAAENPIELARRQTQAVTDELWQVLDDIDRSRKGQSMCDDYSISFFNNNSFEDASMWVTFRDNVQINGAIGFTVKSADDVCFECLGIMRDSETNCSDGLNGYVVTWSRYPAETYSHPSEQAKSQIHGMDPVSVCAKSDEEAFAAMGWDEISNEMDSLLCE